jgi:hypothetical protein
VFSSSTTLLQARSHCAPMTNGMNGFHNVRVAADGTAYIAADGSRLLLYEPDATELRVHPEGVPVVWCAPRPPRA